MKKSVFTKKNIVNALFIGLFLTILFVPSAKALVMRGLMEIGLFKPSISEQKNTLPVDLSSIKFKDATNKVVSLGDLKGKVVFLNFWATWCPPCLAEMPAIHKLYQKFAADKEVVFLLVDADGNLKKAQAYLDRKNYSFPLFNVASEIPDVIFNGSLPTTIVFDKKGRIAYNGVGAANYASPKFISFIKELKALKE
ncbi:TlpA family protein disulfide reductase [Pedobacter insulae]|uniref:Thiol-disulfide isomerase or thioredoxin n=1 Tax=Pedobacter insulae TaxID=414048 RepID=A0A1I2X9V0_9SPHI|nr:TlpA disulfide reductase family protein [Pedobacter insulae]SFH10310.1 Thiol-disulfide isomerase or thioredoxin [Pedobacter insulae]